MEKTKNQVSENAVTDKKVKAAKPNRLFVKYKKEVIPAMVKAFNYKNINEVPKVEKIVLNMGLGDVKDNSKSFKLAVEELALIAGQKPVVTNAKKSVANFKLREGMSIGCQGYPSWYKNVRVYG